MNTTYGSKRLWQAVIVLGLVLALLALGMIGTAYAGEGARYYLVTARPTFAANFPVDFYL